MPNLKNAAGHVAGKAFEVAGHFAKGMRDTFERDIEVLRRDLTARIGKLDESILAKEAEYDALTIDSVSNEDAAVAIVESLRGTMSRALDAVTRRALFACDLGVHRPTRRYAWDPAVPGGRETTSPAAGLAVAQGGFQRDALLDLCVTLWSEDAAMQFARGVLQARPEPTHGLNIDQLHAKAEKLADEIRALYKDRWEVYQKVAGFIEIGLVHAPTPPEPLRLADYKEPSVKVQGNDGVMRETVTGFSMQESIGFAEARRAAERRQQIEADREAAAAEAQREKDRLDELVTGQPQGRWAGLFSDDKPDKQ